MGTITKTQRHQGLRGPLGAFVSRWWSGSTFAVIERRSVASYASGRRSPGRQLPREYPDVRFDPYQRV